MGLASSVAIAAAERVERTGGPRAGLAVWRTVAENAVDPSVKAAALLAAFQCALELRDGAVLVALAPEWERIQAGIHDDVFDRVRSAALLGFVREATVLARAEASRHRSARSLHAFARCLELSGDLAHAEAVLAEATARAEQEGSGVVASAARLRRAVILARAPERMREALEEARRVDGAQTPLRDRLALAGLLLRSPSRFVRAGAIDLLDPLVSGEDERLADLALDRLAAHADDAGDELTPMEADRLLALFARPSVEKRAARARNALEVVAAFARARAAPAPARDEAVARAIALAAGFDPGLAALHARARDFATGRYEAHAAARFEVPATRSSAEEALRDAWTVVLDLAFAMRDAARPRAVLLLRSLRERGARGIPVQVWTPLVTALLDEDRELREAAIALAEVLLAPASRRAPPRGWREIAEALARTGRDDLAEHARRASVSVGEPGAAEALATTLTRTAWALARAGERSRARALLQEARALAVTSAGSPSPPPGASGTLPSSGPSRSP